MKHTIVDSVKVRTESSQSLRTRPPPQNFRGPQPPRCRSCLWRRVSALTPASNSMILILVYLLCVCFVWSRRLACG